MAHEVPLNPDDARADGLAMDLNSLLKQAVDLGASDLHLKVDQPPIVRQDGHLNALKGWPPLGWQQLPDYVNDVGATDPKRLAAFHETGELDTAYQVAGLPRFRV